MISRSWTRFLNLKPHWKLFLLAPVMAELVSHHQPLWEFFNPIIILITFVPYGCGALVARELAVRNGKGWASLLLLGAAFSLVFEGIVTRVMFNPLWDELGALADYQHVAGVNWSLALALTHFHVALSIFSAVALAEMFHPEQRHASWISTRALLLCAAAVPAWTLVIGLFVSFVPPALGVIGLIGLALALIVLALWMPPHPFAAVTSTPRPWIFGVVGGAITTAIMLGVYVVPEMASPPPLLVTLVVLLALDVLAWGWLVRASGGGARWTDQHRLALVAGLLAFFILFGFLQDLGAITGNEPFAARSLVSIGTIWGLRRTWRLITPSGTQPL